ncbi:MAG: guanylate kinase [Gammaproteobacteria bacterium]|nr:guanylate kinase [Gammaproteobacteria bacterium]
MSNNQHNLGQLYIVAAPSGGGKTSLVNRLIQSMPSIEVSVSHTTRLPRPKESDGQDYFFINKAEFESMIEEDVFLEYAKVFDNYYGTSKKQIEARLAAGIDVVLDIDWQGAQQIRAIMPNVIGIFLLPPSLQALRQRLENRQQDNQAVIDKRMKQAQDELEHYHEFDYLIVNEEFDLALSHLKSILTAERLKRDRQVVKQRKLLSFLLANG